MSFISAPIQPPGLKFITQVTLSANAQSIEVTGLSDYEFLRIWVMGQITGGASAIKAGARAAAGTWRDFPNTPTAGGTKAGQICLLTISNFNNARTEPKTVLIANAQKMLAFSRSGTQRLWDFGTVVGAVDFNAETWDEIRFLADTGKQWDASAGKEAQIIVEGA